MHIIQNPRPAFSTSGMLLHHFKCHQRAHQQVGRAGSIHRASMLSNQGNVVNNFSQQRRIERLPSSRRIENFQSICSFGHCQTSLPTQGSSNHFWCSSQNYANHKRLELKLWNWVIYLKHEYSSSAGWNCNVNARTPDNSTPGK